MQHAIALAVLLATPAMAEAQKPVLTEYALPAFDSIRIPRGHAFSRAEYDSMRLSRVVAFEILTYSTDGLQVNAHVVTPREPAGKHPVIVFNRGSYTVADWFPLYAHRYDTFAGEGSMVVAPQYRGSVGAQGQANREVA